MSLMQRLLNYKIDPFVLGVFRIGCGIFLVIHYLTLAANWMDYYGPFAFSPQPIRPWSQFNILMPSVFLHPMPDFMIWGFYILCLIASFLFTLGLGGRAPILWLWFANFSLAFRNFMALNSEEQVLAILFFWCLFLPLEKTLCLRRKNKKWVFHQSFVQVRAWPLILFQIHFALVYFVSWPFKLSTDEAWGNGTAIYYALNHYGYSRFPGLEIYQWGNAFISKVATAYTLIIELAFPLFVWFKKFRMPLVIGLAGLHLCIGILLHGVSMFNWTMILGVLLFVPSPVLRKALQ